MRLVIKIDSKLPAFGKKASKAMKAAGSKALTAMRAAAKREIRKRVAIRAGYLSDKALPLIRPRGSNIHRFSWTMLAASRPVPLGEYPARQTAKGVSVEVVRGARKLIKSAFMAKRRASVRKGVFLRPGKARYPMGHRVGMSVADLFHDGKTADVAIARFQSVFLESFAYLYGS